MRGINSMAKSFPREELMPRNKQPEIFNFLKYRLCIDCTFCKQERYNTCVLHQKVKTRTFVQSNTKNFVLFTRITFFILKEFLYYMETFLIFVQ